METNTYRDRRAALAIIMSSLCIAMPAIVAPVRLAAQESTAVAPLSASPLSAPESPPITPESTSPLPLDDVNAFDRAFAFRYSPAADKVSDYTQYAAFLSPAILGLAAPPEDWLGIGAMYAGTSLCSYAARTLLKAVIERERPYMYFDGPPAGAIDSGEHLESFPSGHSIMAFSGAGFTAAVLWMRYPDSPYRIPATAGAYAIAVATAALRVGSGSHFVTDVLGGIAIGSIFGFAIPFAVYSLTGGE